MPTDEQRRIAAAKILDIGDELDSIYDRIAHFDAHGVLPPPPDKSEENKIKEMDMGQLIRRQITLRTYVSRYSRLVKTGKTVAGVAKNQELLDKYTIELEEVDKKLEK